MARISNKKWQEIEKLREQHKETSISIFVNIIKEKLNYNITEETIRKHFRENEQFLYNNDKSKRNISLNMQHLNNMQNNIATKCDGDKESFDNKLYEICLDEINELRSLETKSRSLLKKKLLELEKIMNERDETSTEIDIKQISDDMILIKQIKELCQTHPLLEVIKIASGIKNKDTNTTLRNNSQISLIQKKHQNLLKRLNRKHNIEKNE